jgi:hypothetical protein
MLLLLSVVLFHSRHMLHQVIGGSRLLVGFLTFCLVVVRQLPNSIRLQLVKDMRAVVVSQISSHVKLRLLVPAYVLFFLAVFLVTVRGILFLLRLFLRLASVGLIQHYVSVLMLLVTFIPTLLLSRSVVLGRKRLM